MWLLTIATDFVDNCDCDNDFEDCFTWYFGGPDQLRYVGSGIVVAALVGIGVLL